MKTVRSIRGPGSTLPNARGRAALFVPFPVWNDPASTLRFALPRDAEPLAEAGGFVFLGASRSYRNINQFHPQVFPESVDRS
jgi:hypothetical protein